MTFLLGEDIPNLGTHKVLTVEDLVVHYGGSGVMRRKAVPPAVNGVSFSVHQGETLGLVGESGCGKSSIAKAVVRLVKPASGHIRLMGQDLGSIREGEMKGVRRRLQMVFQDPGSSLDPKQRIRTILSEPLRIHGYRGNKGERIAELLELVGLNADMADRFPHEFSGGQRQRIGIARALAVEPDVIVCDEPISALDVSVQAQILNLLSDLRDTLGLTFLFIAHNIPAVVAFSDRVAVMYAGQFVEVLPAKELAAGRAAHPYTQVLLKATPLPDPQLEKTRRRTSAPELDGEVDLGGGCRYRFRCPLYKSLGRPEVCRTNEPALAPLNAMHEARCHFANDEKVLLVPEP